MYTNVPPDLFTASLLPLALKPLDNISILTFESFTLSTLLLCAYKVSSTGLGPLRSES